MIHSMDVITGTLTEGVDAPSFLTNAQLMSIELAALTAKFKADDLALQNNWWSATVVDGATEDSKKAAIQQDRATLKTQFTADKAAIIAKYS